jgi:ferritin-like metal-binding protein YciE
MDKIKRVVDSYWQIIVAIALVIFNVGYTIAQLETKPSREEVKKEIKQAIDEHKLETKDSYVRIDQVPGLLEQLNSINNQLTKLDQKLDKLEDKFIYKTK